MTEAVPMKRTGEGMADGDQSDLQAQHGLRTGLGQVHMKLAQAWALGDEWLEMRGQFTEGSAGL